MNYLFIEYFSQCCYEYGCNFEWAPSSEADWAHDWSPKASYDYGYGY